MFDEIVSNLMLAFAVFAGMPLLAFPMAAIIIYIRDHNNGAY